jgi:NAD(P)-dependent dehydrogenase (short-subunit alcohol dehydrogenase family)
VEGLGVPDHDTYAYSAAKAGLHHLSRHLAGRLGPEGILSNTIACGVFNHALYEFKRLTFLRLGAFRSKCEQLARLHIVWSLMSNYFTSDR